MSSTLILPRPLNLSAIPSLLEMSSCGELNHNFSGWASTVHVGVELSGGIPMRSGVQPGSVKGPFLFHLRFKASLDLNSHWRRITQNKTAKDVRQVEPWKVAS